jgi:hypothetical protein
MAISNRNVPVNEARQALRQLARDLNFEFRQLSKRVDDLRAALYDEAKAIREEHRAGRAPQASHGSRAQRVPVTLFGSQEEESDEGTHD